MIGGRVAFSLSSGAHVGTITKEFPGGSLMLQLDGFEDKKMVVYPGIDDVKPVYRWSKIRGEKQ